MLPSTLDPRAWRSLGRWLVLGMAALFLSHAAAQTAQPQLVNNALTLEQGATAALVLRWPSPTAQADYYGVINSRPEVAQIPASLSVAKGTAQLTLAVHGLSPGASHISLWNGVRMLTATVTVLPGLADLSQLLPAPAGLEQGARAQLLLSLSAAVRSDTAVTLRASSSDADHGLELPSEVLIPAGQSSVQIPLRALAAGTHQVTASLGRQQLSAWLRVTAALSRPLSLLPASSSVETGASAKLSLRLSSVSKQGLDLQVAATPAGIVSVPATLAVPAGSDRAELLATALKPGQATVTVKDAAGQSVAADWVVRASAAAQLKATPPMLALRPGASGEVSIEIDAVRAADTVFDIALLQHQAGPAGGWVLQAPQNLLLPAGQRTARFGITALTSGKAVLGLQLNHQLLSSVEVQVRDDAPQITGLEPAEQSLPKGALGQARVQISRRSQQASELGVTVDNGVLSVPQSVQLAAGAAEVSVPIQAREEGLAQLSVTLGDGQARAALRVTPAEVEELRPPARFDLGLGNVMALPISALMTDGVVRNAPDGVLLKSADEKIFKVTANGELEGLSLGQAALNLSLGPLKARSQVTVKEFTPLSLMPPELSLPVGTTQNLTLSIAAPAPAGGLVVALSYQGQGGVEFASPLVIAAGSRSQSFAFKALSEGQGVLLAQAAGYRSAKAQISMTLAQMSIQAMAPRRGVAGTRVTLTGVGFDPQVSANRAWVGEVPAQVVAASRSELTLVVAANASTGAVRVSNGLGSALGPVFTVDLLQDAGLSATPNALRLLRGSEANAVIGIVSSGLQAYAGSMKLTVSGLPSGVSASFEPDLLPAGRNATLRLAASAAVTPGSYAIRVSGAGMSSAGAIAPTVQIQLTVPDPQATPSTGVRGRFVTPEGAPIAGVIVRADTGGQASPSTASDAAGSWELAGLGEGAVTLRFDATPANPLFPIWPFSTQVKAGVMLVLKDFVIAPPPAVEAFTPISNGAQEQRISDPRYPGLEIVLPQGVDIIGWDGVKKTRIAVEKREISSLPTVPPPVPTGAAYQLYFGTPMGGIPSKPIPITLPNDTGAEPGESVNVWFFDGSPMGGTGEWKVAGQAQISGDGKTARMVNGG